jgi:flotillin
MNEWLPFLLTVSGILIVILLVLGYKKTPPNCALIISSPFERKVYGLNEDGLKVPMGKSKIRVLTGGATYVIPFLERVDRISLAVMSVDIKTVSPIPTKTYIGLNIDGVANIKISSIHSLLLRASEQFLGKDSKTIAATAMQVLEGNMREIIGTMDITEIVQNRDKFAQNTQLAAKSDMEKMGLEIVNLTIQNFNDVDGVLKELSTKNVANIKRDASISRAEAEKETRIAQAISLQQAQQKEMEAKTAMAEQVKNYELKAADYKALIDEAKANADAVYEINQQKQLKNIKVASVEAEIAKREKDVELERKQVEVTAYKLSAEYEKTAEVQKLARIQSAEAALKEKEYAANAARYNAEKEAEIMELQAKAKARAIELEAEAKANAMRLEAAAKADAISKEGLAEAEAIKAKGLAEAEAIDKKAEAMNKMGDASILQMAFEVLPKMTEAAASPLTKIDKITMYGDGNTPKITKDVTQVVAQMKDAIKDSTGFDVEKIIAKFLDKQNKNGNDVIDQ